MYERKKLLSIFASLVFFLFLTGMLPRVSELPRTGAEKPRITAGKEWGEKCYGLGMMGTKILAYQTGTGRDL